MAEIRVTQEVVEVSSILTSYINITQETVEVASIQNVQIIDAQEFAEVAFLFRTYAGPEVQIMV